MATCSLVSAMTETLNLQPLLRPTAKRSALATREGVPGADAVVGKVGIESGRVAGAQLAGDGLFPSTLETVDGGSFVGENRAAQLVEHAPRPTACIWRASPTRTSRQCLDTARRRRASSDPVPTMRERWPRAVQLTAGSETCGSVTERSAGAVPRAPTSGTPFSAEVSDRGPSCLIGRSGTRVSAAAVGSLVAHSRSDEPGPIG